MARVVITDPADADSTEIIRDLTAKAGELVADRYEAEFDDTVTIMRIVHGRRRITRRMSNRPTTPP